MYCCRGAFRKRNGCAQLICWMSLAWKKAGCRSLMVQLFTTGRILLIVKLRSKTSEILVPFNKALFSLCNLSVLRVSVVEERVKKNSTTETQSAQRTHR